MKKFIFLGIAVIIVIGLLAVDAQPASAYTKYCWDPDDGPMECYYDYSAEEYCLLHLPTTVPASYNPQTVWDAKKNVCYFYHDEIGCAPNWNKLSGFYQVYTSSGNFYDGTRFYTWINTASGCAISRDGNWLPPAKTRVSDYYAGSTEIRFGEFDYDYGTCSGLCRISTTRMTPPAVRALELIPYKVYKKAFVTILNEEKELAQGTFRLCYNHDYNEKKNPAYFRFNGTDWSYFGGFWNVSRTKFCMYSEESGNYVLAEMGQN